jgi:membrane protein
VNIVAFCKKVISEFGIDKAGTLSAAFAYIAIFSIGPILLILISLAGFVLGEKAASGQLFTQLSNIVGADAAQSIQNAVAHTRQSHVGVIAFILGIVGTILAAIGLSNQLQNSFDIIFDAVPDPKSSIKRTIYTKIKNILLLGCAGLVVIISVVLSTIVSILGDKLKDQYNFPAFAVESMNTVLSLLIFIAILYLIYKVLPDVFIPKKIILSTAVVVGALFMVGKVILAIIIGHNSTASAYGAAASIIILMLWFYYSAQILLLGAEGIKVYGDNHGLVYKAKRYTLKRRTLKVDLQDNLLGRSIEKFAQGYKKASKKNK